VFLLPEEGGPAIELAGDALLAMIDEHGKVLVARTDGTIEAIDPVAKRRHLEISRKGKLRWFGHSTGWIVAIYADGHVVRRDTRTGVDHDLVLRPEDTSEQAFAYVRPDGDACIPRGRTLSCFSIAGEVVKELALPDVPVSVETTGEHTLVVGQPD